MIVPAVHVLEDYIVVEWNKEALRALPSTAAHHQQHNHHPNPPPPPKPIVVQPSSVSSSSHGRDSSSTSSGWVAVDRGHVDAHVDGSLVNSVNDTGSSSRTVIEQCLETLALLILDNFARLSKYPTFDKLWLRTLQCLIHFSEAPTALIAAEGSSNSGMGFSGMAVISDPVQSEERLRFLQQISKTSTEQIRLLLNAIQESHVFEQRPALKTITAEFMRQTTYAAPLLGLIESNSPSTNADSTGNKSEQR